MALPKQRTTVVDSVAHEIIRAIREGRLAPGQRLIESDFTREFGVSRAPVREALARLASLGIVEIQQNRGASVPRLTQAQVNALMELREPLEGLAARLAARSEDKKGRANLSRILERTRAARGDLGHADYVELNEAFHGAVSEMSNNPQLQAFLEPLHLQSFSLPWQVWTYTARGAKESNDEHVQIGQAILERKPELAERLMREHIRKSAESRAKPRQPADSSSRRFRR